MHEPLTTQLVAELMRDLLTAFPSKHSEKNLTHTAEVYRNGLRGVTGEALRAAVDVSIKSDSYFPKIARLRELATEWTKRNVVTATLAYDSRLCRFCQTEATPRKRYRPRVGKWFIPRMDGEFLLLEEFTRDFCDCVPPCFYEPTTTRHLADVGDVPACKAIDVQRSYKAWLEKRAAQRPHAEAAD